MRAKEVNFSGETVKSLRIIKLIGQGNWADVYLAENMDTQEKAAVKVTSQKKLAQVPKLRELIQAQISILKQCHNPNVVKLIDDFVYADHQFIVLEYCSGFELGDILLREKKLDEPTAVNYLKQILNGFKGLHEVHAMHRDFKVENVMLHEGVCKIVDLGFGKQLMGGELATTKLGSNLTMAPEVMQALSYDFRADIWSIGVVFYQMLYGKFPIRARGPVALLQKARNHEYSLQSDEVSDDAKDFISKCLKFDPDERINWIDIYRHPLIVDENHEIHIGRPQSKINVEENINFYLKSEKQLQKQVAPPEVVKEQVLRSVLRFKQSQPPKEQTQIFLSVVKEEPSINQQSNQQQAKRKEIERQNQLLSQQLLREEKLQVLQVIANIKYQYMEEIDNIEFISRYAISVMKDTQSCNINHIPIICLLLKDAYIRLEYLNDSLNFRRNIFELDPTQFQYFLDDEEMPQMLKVHLQQGKQLFQQYRGFLSEEEYKDHRLQQALKSISSRIDFSEEFFDQYLYSHAKAISNIVYSDNWGVYCKLLKLSFCLFKYSRHKNNKFSRKRILASLNNFNCQQAFNAERNRANAQNRIQPQPQLVPRRRRPVIRLFRFFGWYI